MPVRLIGALLPEAIRKGGFLYGMRQPARGASEGLRTVARAVGGHGEGAAGRLPRAFGARKSGRVWTDGHFVVRMAIALPLPAEKA